MGRAFSALWSRLLRKIDTRLDLGALLATVPPAWCMDGMKHFDVQHELLRMSAFRQTK